MLVEDVYRQIYRPDATGAELKWAARAIVVGLGAFAVVLCWGRITTLAEMIQFTGAFVASTIWPIAAGLYWPNVNRTGVALALLFGSAAGLTAYFTIGFYTAALVSAGVSMAALCLTTWLSPQAFDWNALKAIRRAEEASSA